MIHFRTRIEDFLPAIRNASSANQAGTDMTLGEKLTLETGVSTGSLIQEVQIDASFGSGCVYLSSDLVRRLERLLSLAPADIEVRASEEGFEITGLSNRAYRVVLHLGVRSLPHRVPTQWSGVTQWTVAGEDMRSACSRLPLVSIGTSGVTSPKATFRTVGSKLAVDSRNDGLHTRTLVDASAIEDETLSVDGLSMSRALGVRSLWSSAIFIGRTSDLVFVGSPTLFLSLPRIAEAAPGIADAPCRWTQEFTCTSLVSRRSLMRLADVGSRDRGTVVSWNTDSVRFSVDSKNAEVLPTTGAVFAESGSVDLSPETLNAIRSLPLRESYWLKLRDQAFTAGHQDCYVSLFTGSTRATLREAA